MSGSYFQSGKKYNWDGVIEFLQERSKNSRFEMDDIIKER